MLLLLLGSSRAIGEGANRSVRGARAPLPGQCIEIDIAPGENDPDALATKVDLGFLNSGERNGR